MNPVCVKRPIGEYLLFAEFGFRQLDGLGRVRGLDFQKTLANFSLMAVLARTSFRNRTRKRAIKNLQLFYDDDL